MKTKKPGSVWNRNSPSSTWTSALLSDGLKAVCPAVLKDLTTAPSDPKTTSDVPSPMLCTAHACTQESTSLVSTEKSCLDNKNTRSDLASE